MCKAQFVQLRWIRQTRTIAILMMMRLWALFRFSFYSGDPCAFSLYALLIWLTFEYICVLFPLNTKFGKLNCFTKCVAQTIHLKFPVMFLFLLFVYRLGLDPASIMFVKASSRLSADAADFVDIIHTDGGVLGYPWPLGHSDWYPNLGENFLHI